MTRQELAQVFVRLGTLYTPPKSTELDSEAYIREWLGVLGSLEAAAVHRAVDAYTASAAKFWPRPGQLARWIRRHQDGAPVVNTPRIEYERWEATWGRRDLPDAHGQMTATYSACPVCGAMPGTYHGRLRVPHQARIHRAKNLPVMGWSDEVAAHYGQEFPDAA